MKRNLLTGVCLLAFSLLVLTGCTDEQTVVEGPGANAYIGSATCGFCHETIHQTWSESGHPYKLTKIDGVAPTAAFPAHAEYPNDAVDPPNGLGWEDISYTIGGFGWKMRWIDEQGYIVTSGAAGDLVQYNFASDGWVTYHTDAEPGTKGYDCGGCHTTGWIADEDWATDDDLSDNQGGLPGMLGTFEAGGIHCEACHGMGSDHAASQDAADIYVDRSPELCGQCHTRDAANHIAAGGGFIQHHEQYDEWSHSPHSAVGAPGCIECHDPHASVKFDAVAAGEGLRAGTGCADCHTEITTVVHTNIECTDCHMPKATKSAVSANRFQGDIRTHIFAINPSAVDAATAFFNAGGDLVQEDSEGMARITLDFACYGCHRDPISGEGGPRSLKTLAELAARAAIIHQPR